MIAAAMLRYLAPLLPLLLIGFSVGGQQISPNYRWCAQTSRGLKCFATESQCRSAARPAMCDLRLVAEPMRGGQPVAPR